MPWWLAAQAAIMVGSALYKSSQQRSAGSRQAAWQEYNARMKYNVQMSNIAKQTAIAGINARMAQAGAGIRATGIAASAAFNAKMIRSVAMYNDLLAEEELRLIESKFDLDSELMAKQRAVELGSFRAARTASGTVIDEGSNADVAIDQMTQAAMDQTILRHNADIQAARINNSRAQSLWMGEMEARKVAWEGKMGATAELAMGGLESAGIMATAGLQAAAGRESAFYGLQSGMFGAEFTKQEANAAAWNTMVGGFAGAASSAIGGYYGAKVPGTGSSIGYSPAPYRGIAPMTPGVPSGGPGSSLIP